MIIFLSPVLIWMEFAGAWGLRSCTNNSLYRAGRARLDDIAKESLIHLHERSQ